MALKINSYLGHLVFGEEPNWISEPKFNMNRPYDYFGSVGVGVRYSHYEFTEIKFIFEYLFQNKQEIWEMKNFFDDRKGRYDGFWIPSWRSDIIVTSDFDITDTQLNIQDIEYSDNWLNNDVEGRHIAIIHPDGTHIYRKILSAPSSTIITLDKQLEKAVTTEELNSLLISFLHFVRFDQDEMVLTYYNPNIAKSSFGNKSIPNEMTAVTTTTSSSTTTTSTTV